MLKPTHCSSIRKYHGKLHSRKAQLPAYDKPTLHLCTRIDCLPAKSTINLPPFNMAPPDSSGANTPTSDHQYAMFARRSNRPRSYVSLSLSHFAFCKNVSPKHYQSRTLRRYGRRHGLPQEGPELRAHSRRGRTAGGSCRGATPGEWCPTTLSA
jgi:hypothetical protein